MTCWLVHATVSNSRPGRWRHERTRVPRSLGICSSCDLEGNALDAASAMELLPPMVWCPGNDGKGLPPVRSPAQRPCLLAARAARG
jgi:hypothetical protein